MNQPQLAIKSSRILISGSFYDGFLRVNHGRISSVFSSTTHLTPEDHLIDASDSIVMSGLIDPHVHLNQPGRTHWEGVETGTMAALAGGVTTLVDMPLNCSPVTTTKESLNIKLNSVKRQLYCHCGFWGGLTPDSLPHLNDLLASGVMGVKAFLTHSGLDEFPNVTRSDLEKAMPAIAKSGCPLLVHAELESCIPTKHQETSSKYHHFLHSRPDEWEVSAISMMCELAEKTGCRVHIVHLSSAAALPVLAEAKQKGLPITVETCPHYLSLEAESIPDGSTNFKCTPPIRTSSNQAELWAGLNSGIIDFIASDHSPCSPELKLAESGDFLNAWGGISSLQLSLPILWDKLKSQKDGVSKLWSWLSQNPAKFLGLAHSKGDLKPEMDADIMIWDPDAPLKVSPESLYIRHKISPYMYRTLTGKTEITILGGRIVFCDDSFPLGATGQALFRQQIPQFQRQQKKEFS